MHTLIKSLKKLFSSSNEVSAILRSGRNKTKTKKSKNKKGSANDETITSATGTTDTNNAVV